jgi:hypothetical protein
MYRLVLLCGALLLTACPGGGGECDGGTCPPDAGFDGGSCKGTDPAGAPPNLLANPGFECGDPPSGWYAQNGQLTSESTGGHSGSKAARLTAPTATVASNLWHETDVVVAPGTKTYCVNAWVRGSAANARITVRKVKAGFVNDENFSIPLTPEWQPIPPAATHALKVVGAGEDKFVLRIFIPDAKAGDYLLVDDVLLWESPGGNCTER